MKTQQVILVNERDEQIGVAEKMHSHKESLLHRAFSIFIFNSRGEMLLQQRALNKYHSGGLWTNACCSHPQPGEEIIRAASVRLMEEMGFETSLEKIFDFIYKAKLDNGMTEYEFDHVFVGVYDGKIICNKGEVMEYCYKEMQEIRQSLLTHSAKYTEWFQLAFPKVEEWWSNWYNSKVA